MGANVMIGFRQDIIRIPISDSRFRGIIPIAAGNQETTGTFTHFNLFPLFLLCL